uniref:coiled-coil domain-containing protein n=1 Tax=Pilimelia terevasa TaxID=53372 RepID=UPI003570A3B6
MSAGLAALLTVVAGAPAAAAPPPSPTPKATPTATAPKPSGEENSPLLRDVLDQVGRGWSVAKANAESSKRRQEALAAQVAAAQKRHDALLPQVSKMAAGSYRIGRLGMAATLLENADAGTFVSRATRLGELNTINDTKLHELNQAITELNRAHQALAAEAQEEQRQLTIMDKQKREAEKALALVGGRGLTGGLVSARSPVAKAAPRAADGTFPPQSCDLDDPTTGGCVTARTLHAYRETKRAGFNRFVGCYRPGGPFEHPKGRACDWSLLRRGFRPAANQDEKMYGNNLTAFLVRNADRLGILYVIWYRQIWFPATGWAGYSGDSDHTDHVHMSML